MYPYIELDGQKLSLIYPYTLNDELITDLRYEHFISDIIEGNILICFKLFNNNNYYSFSIQRDSINYFNTLINRILQEYAQIPTLTNSSILFEISQILSDANDDYLKYLYEHIRDQCHRLRFNINERQIIRSLENQDRPLRGLRVLTPEVDTLDFSFNFSLSNEYVKKEYVHMYNYIPYYEKHYMPNEDTTTLLLGAEIEVDNGGKDNEEVAKKMFKNYEW